MTHTKTHMKKHHTTKPDTPKKAPLIDLPSHPEEAQQVARLVIRHGIMRADDMPEEAANRLAAMALMLGYVTDREYTLALATVEELWSTYPYSRTQPAYSIARAMALRPV